MQTELFKPRIALRLTTDQAYQRKQRIFKLFIDWQRRVIKAFFPDTGGNGLMMHNWYRCDAKNNPEGAKLADWIEESTWQRYRKLEAKLEARHAEREHMKHTPGNPNGFWPYWCPLCCRKD